MADSSFFTYRFQNRIPITYLLMEIFGKVAEKFPEASVAEHLSATLAALEIPADGPDDTYSEELLIGVADDMRAVEAERTKRAGGKGGKAGKGPGAEFTAWIAEQDFESTLLLVANFDYDLASRLYSSVPILTVDNMIKLRIEMESQRIQATFESVVYGTGGKMKGGSRPDKAVDASPDKANTQEFKSALKSAGF